MEYGPAPESDKPALAWLKKHDAASAISSAAWTEPGETSTSSTRRRARCSRASRRAARRTSTPRRRGARRCPAGGSGARRARARALPLRARARRCRSTRASSPCSSRMDNGKPIRETRDIDIPLVARHFYHHAGWAQLLDTEFPGYEAVGVVGQIIPWNFPLLMLAWKVAPALARQHGRAQAGRVHAAHRAAVRRDRARGGLPPGVLNIVTGDGATGAALVDHPDVDKIAFTGSTEVGRIIRKATAGSARSSRSSSAARARSSSSTTPISTAWSKAWSTRSGSIRARSAAPARGSWCRKASPIAVEKLRARMEKLRVGSPLDKAVDMGAIVAPVQLERIRAGRAGRRGRRDDVAAVVGCPTEGLLLSADAVHRRLAVVDDRAGRDLRAGARDDDLPHARGIGRAREQHAVRPRRERLDGEHQSRARHRAEAQGRRGLDQLTNLFDAAAGFGGYREAASAARAARRDVGVCESRMGAGSGEPGEAAAQAQSLATHSAPRSQLPAPPDRSHAKLFIGGKQARPDQGYSRASSLPTGRVSAKCRRQSQGHSQRRRGGARRGGLGQGDGHNARADSLLHRRESRARADEFAAHRRRWTAARSANRVEVDARRAALHVCRLGRQVGRRRAQRPDPRRRARDERADRRDRYRRSRRVPAAGLRLAVAPAIAVGNTSSSCRRRRTRSRRRISTACSRRRTSPTA
jgi:aldehyde dehydrogenase (NAD+)